MRHVAQSTRDKAEPAARKAIQFAPDLADGYRALAALESRSGKFLLAEELYLKALALDPNYPEALEGYSLLIVSVGRVKEGLVMKQQLHALEPFVPVSNRNLAMVLSMTGEDDAALAILKPVNENRLVDAIVLAGAGRFEEAADILMTAPSGTYPPDALKEAVRLLRMAPTTSAPQSPVPLGALDFVYLYAGAPGRVLEYYELNFEAGWVTSVPTSWLWHPSYAPARKTERFKALMRKGGMVDYWRERGWPDLCRPMGADDFVCD